MPPPIPPSIASQIDPACVFPPDLQFCTEVSYIPPLIAPKPRRSEPCACDAFVDAQSCVDETCINRASQQECGTNCPAGNACGNRRIHTRSWTPLNVFPAAEKGIGLRATSSIKGQTFIIEYVGEAVTGEELVRRFKQYQVQKMLYILQISPDVFVDARRTGGIARFINHSCDPNCTMEKWIVNGHPRMCVFSLRDIKDGEELTFDYQWEKRDERQLTKCYCGTRLCRGFLESIPASTSSLPVAEQPKGVWRKPTAADKNDPLINRFIKVYFDGNYAYVEADVLSYNPDTNIHTVKFVCDDDPTEENLSASTCDWLIMDESQEAVVVSKKSRLSISNPSPGHSSGYLTAPGGTPSTTGGITPPTRTAAAAAPQPPIYISSLVHRELMHKATFKELERLQLNLNGGRPLPIDRLKCSRAGKDLAHVDGTGGMEGDDGRSCYKIVVHFDTIRSNLVNNVLAAYENLKKKSTFQPYIKPATNNPTTPRGTSVGPPCENGQFLVERRYRDALRLRWAKEGAKIYERHDADDPAGNAPEDTVRIFIPEKAKNGPTLIESLGSDALYWLHIASIDQHERNDLFTHWPVSQSFTEAFRARFNRRIRIECTYEPDTSVDFSAFADPSGALLKTYGVYVQCDVNDAEYYLSMIPKRSKASKYIEKEAAPAYSQHGVAFCNSALNVNVQREETGGFGAVEISESTQEASEIPLPSALPKKYHNNIQGFVADLVTASSLNNQRRMLRDCPWGMLTLPPTLKPAGFESESSFSKVVGGHSESIVDLAARLQFDSCLAWHAADLLLRYLYTLPPQQKTDERTMRTIAAAATVLSSKLHKDKSKNYLKRSSHFPSDVAVAFYVSGGHTRGEFKTASSVSHSFIQATLDAERTLLSCLSYNVCMPEYSAAATLATAFFNEHVKNSLPAPAAKLWDDELGPKFDFARFAMAPQILSTLDKIGAGSVAEILLTALAVAAGSCTMAGRVMPEDIAPKLIQEFYNKLPIRRNYHGSKIELGWRVREIALLVDKAMKDHTDVKDSQREDNATHQKAFKDIWSRMLEEERVAKFTSLLMVVKEFGDPAEGGGLESEGPSLLVRSLEWEGGDLGEESLSKFIKLSLQQGVDLWATGAYTLTLKGLPLAVKVVSRIIAADLRSGYSGEGLLTYDDEWESLSLEEIRGAERLHLQLGAGRVVTRDNVDEEDNLLDREFVGESLGAFFSPVLEEGMYEDVTKMSCFVNGNREKQAGVLRKIIALAENKGDSLDLAGAVQLHTMPWPSKKKAAGEARAVAEEVKRRAKGEKELGGAVDGLSASEHMRMGVSSVGMQEFQMNCYLHAGEGVRGHENIVQLLGGVMSVMSGTGEEDEVVAAPLPYSLDTVAFAEDVTIPPSVLKRWCYSLLKIAKHCHDKGILLRTLELGSVGITMGGELKLMSFANCVRDKVIAEEKELGRKFDYSGVMSVRYKEWKKLDTMEKSNASSRPFMAPELLMGAERSNTRTDSWFVCAMMSCLLLGKKVFGGKNRLSTLQAMFKIVGSVSSEVFKEGKELPMYGVSKGEKKYKQGVEKAVLNLMERKGRSERGVEGLVAILERGLALDPSSRAGVGDLLESEWFVGMEKEEEVFVEDWLTLRSALGASRVGERGCGGEEKIFGDWWAGVGGDSGRAGGVGLVKTGDKPAFARPPPSPVVARVVAPVVAKETPPVAQQWTPPTKAISTPSTTKAISTPSTTKAISTPSTSNMKSGTPLAWAPPPKPPPQSASMRGVPPRPEGTPRSSGMDWRPPTKPEGTPPSSFASPSSLAPPPSFAQPPLLGDDDLYGDLPVVPQQYGDKRRGSREWPPNGEGSKRSRQGW